MNNYIMYEIRMYFEMINEIKPESILDLNMYLARLGAITRKYQDIYISDEIYMVGIDIPDKRKITACSKIYDKIYEYENINFTDWGQYELGTIFGVDISECLSDKKIADIAKKASKICRYLLIDSDVEKILKEIEYKNKKKIIYGDSCCYVCY